MQIEEDSYTGNFKWAVCELCGMIFNFLPANHKCNNMSQSKSIIEVVKLFDEKFPEFKGVGANFPIFKDYPNREHIKQFWLEHFKSLLEEMRMEDKTFPELESDDFEAGYNRRTTEINKHLDNLLSKGEIK